MTNSKLLIWFIGLSAAMLAACKVQQPVTPVTGKALPDTFRGQAMVQTANLPVWKNFFRDTLLGGYIDSALKNNPDVLMALNRLEIAGSELQQAKGALLPTAGVNLAYLQRKFGYYTMDDAGNRTTYIRPGQFVPTHLPDFFTGFQSSWEVDLWGKLRSRKRAARARFLGGLEGTRLVVTSLVSEVASTYFELQALDQELQIIRRAVAIQQSALDVVRVQKEASAATELAVKQFEAQVLNSRGLEYLTLQRIAQQENRMHLLLGRYVGPVLRSTAWSAADMNDSLSTGVPSRMLVNRPDIRQAEQDLMAAGFDLAAARAAFYPSLNITAMIGMQSFQTAFLFDFPRSLAYSMLGGLTSPLLNRSAIKAQHRAATARQAEAAQKYRKSILQGYQEVSTELQNISNLNAFIALKQEETFALDSSVSISGELFRTGRANYLEVLMIQHNALLADLELIEAVKRMKQSRVNLYRALGGGWQ